jgi:hypothetical protein
MELVLYVDLLNERYRRMGFPAYRSTLNKDAPLTPLAKPLALVGPPNVTERLLPR